MERSLNIATHSSVWFIACLTSFMLGFNLSYKHSHFFDPIHFLLNCYAWAIDWTYSQAVWLLTLAPILHKYFVLADDFGFQFFFGLITLYSAALTLETLYRSTVKPFMSHGKTRS